MYVYIYMMESPSGQEIGREMETVQSTLVMAMATPNPKA